MNENVMTYGVTERFTSESELSENLVELEINGYTVIDSGLDDSVLDQISGRLEDLYEIQKSRLGEESLISIKDANTVRAPLLEDLRFLKTILNENLILLMTKLLQGPFVLLMQNGLINRKASGNQQASFHRDLNYQHWISSKPIAANALLCLDDFTPLNGATWVIPGSHKVDKFPTDVFVTKYKKQITAKRGSYLILDGMTFHAAGINGTDLPRRAVNHVFGRPFMVQQIDIPTNLNVANEISLTLTSRDLQILGFEWNAAQNSDVWRLKKLDIIKKSIER